MTLSKMNELYGKGAYSPINDYFGLLSLLKTGEGFEGMMSEIPETLLPKILDIALRHNRSEGQSSDLSEAAIPKKIVDWIRRRSP